MESGGSVSRAAAIVTNSAIQASDRAELRARNKRQKNKYDEPHKSSTETEEQRTARHAKCRCSPALLSDYLLRHEELRIARVEAQEKLSIEAEDNLHAAIRGRDEKGQPTTLAVRTSMFWLRSRHPLYKPSIRVTQDPTPDDPLDLGGLPEAQQRRIAGEAGEGDPEEGGEP